MFVIIQALTKNIRNDETGLNVLDCGISLQGLIKFNQTLN